VRGGGGGGGRRSPRAGAAGARPGRARAGRFTRRCSSSGALHPVMGRLLCVSVMHVRCCGPRCLQAPSELCKEHASASSDLPEHRTWKRSSTETQPCRAMPTFRLKQRLTVTDIPCSSSSRSALDKFAHGSQWFQSTFNKIVLYTQLGSRHDLHPGIMQPPLASQPPAPAVPPQSAQQRSPPRPRAKLPTPPCPLARQRAPGGA